MKILRVFPLALALAAAPCARAADAPLSQEDAREMAEAAAKLAQAASQFDLPAMVEAMNALAAIGALQQAQSRNAGVEAPGNTLSGFPAKTSEESLPGGDRVVRYSDENISYCTREGCSAAGLPEKNRQYTASLAGQEGFAGESASPKTAAPASPAAKTTSPKEAGGGDFKNDESADIGAMGAFIRDSGRAPADAAFDDRAAQQELTERAAATAGALAGSDEQRGEIAASLTYSRLRNWIEDSSRLPEVGTFGLPPNAAGADDPQALPRGMKATFNAAP